MLFTALMAVMTAMPSFAKYDLTIGGETVQGWDGQINESDAALQNYFDKKSSSSSSKVVLGDLVINISKENDEDDQTKVVLSAPTADILLTGNNSFTIGEGCTLEIAPRAKYYDCYLGYGIFSKYPFSADMKKTSTSTVDLRGTLVAGGQSTLFYAENDAETSATINIYEKGVLTGDYGDENTANADSLVTVSEAYLSGLGSEEKIAVMNTTINVFKGGLIDARNMTIGKSDEEYSRTTTIINLGNEADEFKALGAGELRAYSLKGEKTIIGGFSSSASSSRIPGISDVTINITEGGSFKARGATYIGRVNQNEVSTVNINISGGGVFGSYEDDQEEYNNDWKIGSIEGSKGKAEVNINVSGPGSSFYLAGGFIAYGQYNPTSYSSEVNVTLKDGAVFTLGGKHGVYLGCSSEMDENSTIKIHFDVTDSTVRLRAKIGAENFKSLPEEKYQCSLVMRGNSCLDLSGRREEGDVGYVGVRFYGSVLMEGGRLVRSSVAYGVYGVGDEALPDGITVRTTADYHDDLDFGFCTAGLINEGLQIKGAGTTITNLNGGSRLTLKGTENEINVGRQSIVEINGEACMQEAKALISFSKDIRGGDHLGRVKFNDADTTLTLNLGEALADMVTAGELLPGDEVSFEVWFTNAEEWESGDGAEIDNDWFQKHFLVGAGWGLNVEGREVSGNMESGRIVIKGSLEGEFLEGSMDLGDVDGEKVYVAKDTTLESSGSGGTLKQLEGTGNLNITGQGEVTLENERESIHPGASELTGKLTTDPGINLHKTGSENLTLSGGLDAQGDLSVDEGTLTLTGDDNSIGGKLTLGEEGTLDVDGKLTLNGQGNDLSGVTSGQLTGEGSIFVGDGGSLKMDSKMLDAEDVPGFGATGNGRLEFTGNAPVDLGKLSEDTTGTVAGSFKSNNPAGATFAGSVEGTLTVDGGSLNMSNAANGGCDLEVGSGSSATLAAGSTYHSIDNNGTLSTSTSEETGDVCITAEENIIFRNYAHSPVRIDLSEPDLSEGSSVKEINYKSTAGKIIIEHETELDVTLTGNILDAKGDLNVVIMEAAGGIENPEEYMEQAANYKMKTVRFMAEPQAEEEWEKVTAVAVVAPGEGVSEAVMNQLYDVGNTTFWTKDGQLLTHIPQRTESPWEQYATTANSRAGLGLLYRELHQNGVMEADQDVVELINGIDRLVESNPAEARRALAAVAGSTLTSVSAAQSAALRNQMGRVRDHALQAARLRCAGNADEATAQQRPCKNSHVWVEGTSFFSEQHSVGDESGYRLNSWGGAVGIDAQVDAHWSVGVSLSAGYGDLEAHAADDAKGDLDTYTVSFWSQAKNGRWGNTLLFTLGTNEADLKRTVNYGAGSYTATSNASGSSLGAMWELTYDFHPVKDNKSNILQPLFNVAVMHTSMDGFSEKNAGNVGLAAEKQTRDTVTLGLGLRWLAAINSAKAVNRTVSTEVHANVAQDLGDRRSVANVALLADPNFTQSVYGSKTGSTAFQFGAGVNVPVTPNSQIYVNAGGELREHANAWNAALGVRMGF